MPDDTDLVTLGAGAYLYPGRSYVAVATFRSNIPHAALGALVAHLAGIVSRRINLTYSTLSQFVVSRSEVVPWTHLGVEGQHIAHIFFHVLPRDQEGLSLPLTAGQVRAVCYSVFRENAGLGGEVWVKEIPNGRGNGGGDGHGGNGHGTRPLGPLLIVGLALAGAIYAIGRRR